MIYTFGDGFATGHIWPEWPQIIELISGEPVKVSSAPGAGNEFIYDCAVKASLTADPADLFLVQWALPNRFDKIKQDNQWQQLHDADPVYGLVQPEVNGYSWFCTSGSELYSVKQYHDFYVQDQQAINRTVLCMITLAALLDQRGIKYYYLNTYDMSMLETHSNIADVLKLRWVDGLNGMDEWTKQYPEIRGAEIQPRPLAHARYVVEVMLPKISDIENTNSSRVLAIIKNQEFTPYHPDRNLLWDQIKNQV